MNNRRSGIAAAAATAAAAAVWMDEGECQMERGAELTPVLEIA